MSVWHLVGRSVLWGAVACVVWGVAGLLLARVAHRNNIVDTLWGAGFCLVAVVDFAVSFAAAPGGGPDPLRRVLILVTVLIWGLRLSWHVGRRGIGKGEDPRYAALIKDRKGSPTSIAIRFIFAPQTLTLFLVSLSVQFGMAERGPVRVLGWLGVACWAVGVVFETVGDAQMERFKADRSNKGKLIDVGLWNYTRHPNYFGDAMVWIGIFLLAAERWPGVLTIVSPVLMTYLLAFGTGKRLLEKSMKDRPGYADYMKRTSGFVPLPHSVQRRLSGA